MNLKTTPEERRSMRNFAQMLFAAAKSPAPELFSILNLLDDFDTLMAEIERLLSPH